MVQEGDSVKAGELIANIESDDLAAATKAAEATAASDEQKLREAQETERQDQGETSSANAGSRSASESRAGTLSQRRRRPISRTKQDDTNRIVALAAQGIMSSNAGKRVTQSPASRLPRLPSTRPRVTWIRLGSGAATGESA